MTESSEIIPSGAGAATAGDERTGGLDLDLIVEGIPLPAFLFVGRRMLAVNRRLCELLGFSREDVLRSRDPFADFLSPEDATRLSARAQARAQGEGVPDDYEFTGRRSDGTAIPARARVSPFPAAGPGATLWVCTDERERAQRGAILRVFVDAAVAAQHETSEAGIFAVVQGKLEAFGFRVTFVELQGERFRFLPGASGPFAQAVQALHPGWAAQTAFASSGGDSSQGRLLDDLPGVLSQILHRPRADFAALAGDKVVITSIPVEGVARFVLACSGPNLDTTIAAAFGLFGRQLGAALETARGLLQLRRSNRELLVVNGVASASAALGSGRALTEALKQLVGSLAVDSVALFRREERELVLLDQQGFDRTWAVTAQRLPLGDGSPWGEAASSGERVLFELDALGHTSPQGPRTSADPACVAIPLRVRDDVNGVLVAVRLARLSEDDLRTLGTVAAQMAVSLANVTLLEQAQRRVEELSLLLELGQEALGAPDVDTIVPVAARLFARLLHCTRAFVLLPDAARKELHVVAATGPGQPEAPFVPLPLDGNSLSACAFNSRAPQTTIDAPHDSRVPQGLADRYDCRSSLAVPLLSHDRALGVISLVEPGERVFGAQDLRVATHAAQLVATAIESARLFAEQRARAEEMMLLNEVGRSLAGSLELKPLLELAGATLGKLVDASDWIVFLRDAHDEELRPVAHSANVKDFSGGGPVAPEHIAALAVRSGRAEQTQQQGSQPLPHPWSALALPLIARDHVLGALVLRDRQVGRGFSPGDVERAMAVCRQLALAMLSARLYEDLRSSYSELARAQAELVSRERLAALGELSASIAHEVRNPLGVIFNSVGSLRRILKPEGDADLLLGIIGEEADRLNRMVGDLLDYSRPLEPALQPVQLRSLIEEAVASSQKQAGISAEAVETRLRVGRDVSTVRADARLLRQALVNLFLNAMQAMPRGGRLFVDARLDELASAPAVLIVIADTGPGVPPEVRERIWQPFFTTKATGTGLGLAVVKRIVEGHGGRALLAKSPSGAAFHLLLPLGKDADRAPPV